jgi:hypothetical protein
MTPATVLLIDANAEDEPLFREELALIRERPFELQVVRTLAEAPGKLRQIGGDFVQGFAVGPPLDMGSVGL